MTLDEYADRLEKCMKRELELFDGFHASEEKIRKLITEKNWPALDRELSEIQKYSEIIDEAETERSRIYQCMKLYCADESVESFYAFVSSYCPERSSSLTSLYRQLKVSVMKVKTLTMRIDAYLSTITAAVTRILDEAFPMRKGTIYDSRGTDRGASAPPLVLDRHL